jgi:hypothetical protein
MKDELTSCTVTNETTRWMENGIRQMKTATKVELIVSDSGDTIMNDMRDLTSLSFDAYLILK